MSLTVFFLTRAHQHHINHL